MPRKVSVPLFWRVVSINGAIFVLGTLLLVLSPATVSAQPIWSEAVVLAVGLSVIVVLNALLVGSLLRPLDRLTAAMQVVDPREPGRRLEAGTGPARALVEGFNEMRERLETERRESTALALHATEAERQRIAQELHDEVGQSLTAVLLELARSVERVPPDVGRDLAAVRETARTSLEEVRRISQALRPGVLADLGLLSSLSSLASEFTARTGVPVTRGFAPGLPELSPDAELVVYRVTQEALTNVARHAGASAVEVGLSRRGERLRLRVRDDGQGLGGSASGTGIQGMHERARLVAGTLSLGRPAEGGRGTEVVLELPIGGATA